MNLKKNLKKTTMKIALTAVVIAENAVVTLTKQKIRKQKQEKKRARVLMPIPKLRQKKRKTPLLKEKQEKKQRDGAEPQQKLGLLNLNIYNGHSGNSLTLETS